MSILKNMSYIEDRYLRFLVRDKQLYADCDIEIKRHLWRDNQSLFGDEVSPLLSQYIKNKEHVLFNHESGQAGFFNGSPKSRRQVVRFCILTIYLKSLYFVGQIIFTKFFNFLRPR